MTTFLTVCHLLAPRATLPSRKEFGTLFSASWLVRMIVGRFISPRIDRPRQEREAKGRDEKGEGEGK